MRANPDMRAVDVADEALDRIQGGGTAVGNPGDADDKTSLLAHELTHVSQQSVILAGDDGSEIMRYNLRDGGR